MGEFKDNLSEMAISELEEKILVINQYKTEFIEDYLNELRKRNCFYELIEKLPTNELSEIYSKLLGLNVSENIKSLSEIIASRGFEPTTIEKLNNKEQQKEKSNSRYLKLLPVLLVIAAVKLGLMYVRNDNTERHVIQNNQIDSLETVLTNQIFDTNGILNLRLNFWKDTLSKIKTLMPEKNLREIILYNEGVEKIEVSKILSTKLNTANQNEILQKFTEKLTNQYIQKLNTIIDSIDTNKK